MPTTITSSHKNAPNNENSPFLATTPTVATATEPPPSTKVYYYLDDNTPYLSVIPVADDVITLGDFKKVFTRKGYKYFCKQLDRAIGCEVKVEIRDDSCKLEKSANGLIELVLLSTNTPSGTLPRNVPRKHLTAPSAAAVPSAGGGIDDVRQQIMDSNARKRRSLHEMVNNGLIHLDPNTIPDHRGESVRNCTEDSITASSLSTVISKRAGEGLAELYTSNSEDPYRLEESNSRFTFNSEACSSSAYGGIPVPGAAAASGILGSAPGPSGTNVFAKPHRQRRPRKERYRKAYVPSTISSITESSFPKPVSTFRNFSLTSLSLPRIDVIKLSMTNGAFLGISVLSHDGGIFVSDIIKGGAVYLDGRMEVGDQIVQVNRNSFENLTDGQAVQLLRQAAISRRPITLYVAKRPCNTDDHSDILSGLASETMPIDISLWVESAKQNTLKPLKPFSMDETSSMFDGGGTTGDQSVGPLHLRQRVPVQIGHQPGADFEAGGIYAAERHELMYGVPGPKAVDTNSKLRGAGGTQPIAPPKLAFMNAEDVARRRENEENEQLVDSLNVNMDPVIILKYMARPESGLQIKNRKWLKIPVPMSFIGRELVDWLLDHVHGLYDRKAARTFASKLLADGHIRHVVNKLTFTEKCYYVFDDSILCSMRLPATITTNIIGNHSDSSTSNPTTKTGADAATTEVTYVGSPAPPHQAQKRLLAVTQNVIGCIGNSNSNASGNSSNNNNNNNQALQKQFLTPLSNNNNMNMATGIDQTWPLSPITACGQTGQSSGQRRDDRDSPVTNDYASVIGPDIVTSTMINASITEAPTLKLSSRHAMMMADHRGGAGVQLRRRIDDEIIVSQPPNTPSSLSIAAPNNDEGVESGTDFETVDDTSTDRKRNMRVK